jgi:hypothetical protein
MYHLLYLPMYLCVSYDSQRKHGLFLSSVNKLIAVMVKCGVLFEVRAELLSNI